jgi:uncharacterized protein YbaA (DUF1428 family)
MIQNKTARKLMYEWHSGQWSPMYAAASSGLVESFDALLYDVKSINDDIDRTKLTEWVKRTQAKSKFTIVVCGSSYHVLPWVSRTY